MSYNLVIHAKQSYHWIGIADETFNNVKQTENLFYENPDTFPFERRPPDLDETTFSDFVRGVRLGPSSEPTPDEKSKFLPYVY